MLVPALPMAAKRERERERDLAKCIKRRSTHTARAFIHENAEN